jgi:predicted dehydrogenase
MNIGIIGFGLIGQQRAHDIGRLEHARLVAVYDVDPQTTGKFQEEFNYEIESSWQTLVARTDIDIVVVAVPHYFAPEIVICGLDAGKHVLCEKPMGRSLVEGSRIIQAVRKSGKLLEPGFNYRFYPGIQKVVELMEDGAIGKVTHCRCVLGHGGRPGMEKEWKCDKELCGGGALLDPGIHGIDLLRFLFGEIAEGTLLQKKSFWNINVEDNAFVTLRTEDGKLLSAHFTITEWKSLFRLEIFGTDGFIFLEGRSKSYGGQQVTFGKRWAWLDNTENQKWVYPPDEESFYLELKEFIRVIKGGASASLARPEDGLRAIQIVNRLYDSENSFARLE